MSDLEPWIDEVRTDSGRMEPRVQWGDGGDGYKVIALRESGQEHDLPGRDRLVRRADIPAQRDVMILGERSGGVRSFLDWWKSSLNAKSIPWFFVNAGEWVPELVLRSVSSDPMPRDISHDQQARFLDPLMALGRNVSAAKKAELLIRWAELLHSPTSLIIRITGNDIPASSAHAFRMIREGRDKCPHLHLIIGTEAEATFTAQEFWSGYVGLANCYRLSSFGAVEIRKLLAWHAHQGRKPGLVLSDQAMDQVLDCTGGQPLLVQSLMRRIVESDIGKKIAATEIDKLFQQMKRSPPEAVQFWPSDLRNILKARPELISAMRAYATGDFTIGPARFPPPSQERPLMVSGWVKLDRLGRWGIASHLHASLARPVLDELSRR
jgi:hypothetical protein